MITLKELLTSPCINPAHLANLASLLAKVNLLRAAYGKPLRVTSGYRSVEDHLRIYREKGITDLTKIPMKSKHLIGFAVDLVPIEDDVKHLHDWVMSNKAQCKDWGLYFEAFAYTPTWVHIQIIPPMSGTPFFKP